MFAILSFQISLIYLWLVLIIQDMVQILFYKQIISSSYIVLIQDLSGGGRLPGHYFIIFTFLTY